MSDTARVQFSATIDEAGKVHPQGVRSLRSRLSRWKGKRVLVTVESWRKPKTLPQLGYYHVSVLPAWAEKCGYHLDEMHWELKQAYLAPVLKLSRLTGEEVSERPSLSELTSAEMSEFLSRVIEEGSRMGIPIPPPTEGL